MAEKKSYPLMHPAQWEMLQAFIRTEIEFALSVEDGGRYGRRGLRARMRAIAEECTKVLCTLPMSSFGMDPNSEGDEPGELEEVQEGESAEINSDSWLSAQPSDDDEEEERHEVSRL